MLKLTGAILIVIAAGLCGYLKAEILRKRVWRINGLVSGLVLLENEVTYGKRDIKSVLMSIGEMNKIELFEKAAEYIDKQGVKAGIMKAYEENDIFVSGTEKQAIKSLAENLGMTDTATQIKSIKHARALLVDAKERASLEYEKTGKLYKGAGILIGLAVVIFLL